MEAESKEVARTSGKWRAAGVPQKGWSCVDIEDLGEPNMTCEMCEVTEIRYVHYMEHENYAHTLACGCICAAYMEGSYKRAAARERTMKNAASRRKNWVKRKWRTSSKGNPVLKTDGFLITVFKKGNLWSASIKGAGSDEVSFLKRKTVSVEEAKLAVFDAMLLLKQEQADND